MSRNWGIALVFVAALAGLVFSGKTAPKPRPAASRTLESLRFTEGRMAIPEENPAIAKPANGKETTSLHPDSKRPNSMELPGNHQAVWFEDQKEGMTRWSEIKRRIEGSTTETLVNDLPPMCLSDLPAGIVFPENTSLQGAQPQNWQIGQTHGRSEHFDEAVNEVNFVAGNGLASEAESNSLASNPHSRQAMASKSPAASAVGEEDPHAAIYSRTDYPSAQECATCHQQIYDEWAVSSHAYASLSPMFHAFEQNINDLSQGTIGYFCLRCHAPVATTMGLRRDQPIWDGPKVFREGVTCVACHRVKSHYTKANGERRIEPGDLHSPVYGSGDGVGVETVLKYKSYFKVDSEAAVGPAQSMHRRSIQFEELSESTFCASCHQVAVQPGIKLEVVWDQYRASPSWREGTSCQDCHMGKVPGANEGYTVGPAAVVNGKVINAERRHSNHVFYGPGYPITHPGLFPQNPAADRWSVNEWLLFDWQAGWGTTEFEDALFAGRVRAVFPPIWASPDDRLDAREIINRNLERLAYKKDLRRQVMENGSHLEGPFFLKQPTTGAPLSFHYSLTNTNRGHNLPSGSLGAQPQVWMNVVLIGPDGERLWETGYLDTEGDLADNHSRDVLEFRVPLDRQLFNLQSKFLTTNVKGTDREMYLPVNVDIDQIPFLRPAPQPVSVINHPPFIRMEAHSLPPTATRQAKFVVPAHLIRTPGTYRLSVRMRSRSHPVYFMRFCEATPEMMKAMNQETVDFHVQSVVFEVR